jgi:hypothetical protein
MGMLSFSVTKGIAYHIFQDLRYLKVCMREISGSLTIKHKTERKAAFSELLACLEAKRETFLTQTVTVDESWVHHFELETKVQSMD